MRNIIKRPPLLEGFELGIYQKDLTAWFNNYFYFRGFFIRLKSSLYYLANFKRFFVLSALRLLSYKNRVIDSPSHNSDKWILDSYTRAYGAGDKGLKKIDLTAKKLKYVQQELNKRGKKILFVSAYSGWKKVYGHKINPYYRYFEYYYKNDADKMRETYNGFLKKNDINYFNAQDFLENDVQLNGIETVSFYDAHWNRYGAGIAVIETLKYLKTRYKTDWEIPKIKLVEISSTSDLYEVYALNNLKLFHSLENAFMQKKLEFPYIVYEASKKENQTKIVVLGDSFVEQYVKQLKASHFISDKNVTQYYNQEIEIKADIKKIIDDNDIIIIIYVQKSFYGGRFEQMLNGVYDYLKKQV
ncbi:MAG: hypothetical protein LBB93_00450 [Elusimicrobiota bacterium]|nr:hypothetical protein [Elusimicrobiota bacterium]